MKILVFSDSHHARREMVLAVERESPELVIHLGDLERDAQALTLAFPKLALVSVPGNCDGWTDTPSEKLLSLDGVRILLGHGHTWKVKRGYDLALHAAATAGADILLFGHTHVPYCEQRGALWVLNPGPAPRGYGRILLADGGVQACTLVPMT